MLASSVLGNAKEILSNKPAVYVLIQNNKRLCFNEPVSTFKLVSHIKIQNVLDLLAVFLKPIRVGS